MVNPPSTVAQTVERLGVQVTSFPGMSHWLIGEDGWQGVAAAVLGWAETV
jgi:hypothetical protein